MSTIHKKMDIKSNNFALPKHIAEMEFSAPSHVNTSVPFWFNAMDIYRTKNALYEVQSLVAHQREEKNDHRLASHPPECQPTEGESQPQQLYFQRNVKVPKFDENKRTYNVSDLEEKSLIYEELYYDNKNKTRMIPGKYIYRPSTWKASTDPLMNHFMKYYQALSEISEQARISEKFVEEVNSYSEEDEPLLVWENRQRGAYQSAIIKGMKMVGNLNDPKVLAAASTMYNETDIGRLLYYFNLGWDFQPTESGLNENVVNISNLSLEDGAVSPNVEADFLKKIENEITQNPFVDGSGDPVPYTGEVSSLVEKMIEMIDEIRLSKYYENYVTWAMNPKEKDEDGNVMWDRTNAILRICSMVYEELCPPPEITENNGENWVYVMEWESGGTHYWINLDDPTIKTTTTRPELDIYEIKQIKNPINTPELFFKLLSNGMNPYEIFDTPRELWLTVSQVKETWRSYKARAGSIEGIEEPNWKEFEEKYSPTREDS